MNFVRAKLPPTGLARLPMHLLCCPVQLGWGTRTATPAVCIVGKVSRHCIPRGFDCIRDTRVELDLGKCNSRSSGRSGGKVFDRCMGYRFQCTGGTPKGHDSPPVYGPLWRTAGSLCAHRGFGRQESPTSFVAKLVETIWYGMGADLAFGRILPALSRP